MHTEIEISPEIKAKCPNIRLGVISCSVLFSTDTHKLWEKINATTARIQAKYEIADVKNISTIGDSKKAYKKLGKDPNRYRLSAEALIRRIINGKGLYKINNLVDIVNLSSIESGFSIGAYNMKKIDGKVVLGVGENKEFYEGIGRGDLNIENLPVLRDNLSAFGSPTSDSPRTQLDSECTNLVLIVFDFDNNSKLEKCLLNCNALLQDYALASEINIRIVE